MDKKYEMQFGPSASRAVPGRGWTRERPCSGTAGAARPGARGPGARDPPGLAQGQCSGGRRRHTPARPLLPRAGGGAELHACKLTLCCVC